MKKWNNPELMMLGVEGTNETEYPGTFDSWGKHVCHREAKLHNGACDEGDGHTPIKVGSCIDDKTGTERHPEYSCCCLGLS